MATYQILVMLILIYFGGLMFFETSFNLVSEPARDPITRQGTNRMKLDTIMFYSFTLMTLFNQINCRSLDKDNINVFERIYTNFVFILVLVLELFMTFTMVRAGETRLGSSIFGTASLTRSNHIACWVLGASVLLVNIGIKRIPLELFEKVAALVDLEKAGHDDPVNHLFCTAGDHFQRAKDYIEP
jgi:magnesium-transporting ATPase (P-type)